MTANQTDPSPSRRLLELGPVAQAVNLEAVVDEILNLFTTGAVLYAVDHEFSRLSGVTQVIEAVALDGSMRQAMLAGRPHYDGQRSWIPLPERNESVFVVAVDGPDVPVAGDRAALGALLDGHRRRFEELERGRRRQRMEVAAELQWDTLPMRADTFGNFEVAGVLEPAYSVAGDVFDFAMSGGMLWAYSFDAMGHGLGATVSSTVVLAAIRNVRRSGGSLAEQMQTAGSVLFEQYGGDRFVTGAGCRIDPEGVVQVVNAGHEPIRTVIDGDVAQLDLDVDLPLGVESRTSYRTQAAVVRLAPADGLVMFSDGPASQSFEGELFGSGRLDEALESNWSQAPLETGHGVIDDVLGFLQGDDVDDDVTAVIVRRLDVEENAG